MLYTASYYDPQDWVGQPYRVSRAHPRGRKTQWETLPFLYPPLELLRAYRQGDLDFEALSTGIQGEPGAEGPGRLRVAEMAGATAVPG